MKKLNAGHLAVILFVCLIVMTSVGSVVADRFQKSATFTKDVQPKELDRELRRMAHAIDINAAEIDSVEADIDTLETLHQSVFSACDTTGGQTISANDSAYVTLDKEILEASIYSHATDDYAVGIEQAGMYLVFATVTVATPTSGSADYSYGQINIKKYSSGAWLNVQGGMGGSYIGRTYSPSGQMVASQTISFVAGDSVAIQAKNVDESKDFVTVAEGVSLIIQRLY